MVFKQPESLDECEERIATCAGEQSGIVAKLSDPEPAHQLSAYAYGQWKTGLTQRMALLVRERKLLEAWRSAALRKRADDAAAAKQARRDERTDELQLIRELYGIIRMMYRHYDVTLSDEALLVIKRAEQQLTAYDMLRPVQRISIREIPPS